MGREVRMVPPNWEHPTVQRRFGEGFQPMFDRTFDEAAKEWKEGLQRWENGERPDWCSQSDANDEYWEYCGNPPDRKYYRPWKNEEATWYQVWETVSEGTPVTPPFATQEELIDYLVANGDYWDQQRRTDGYFGGLDCSPWRREHAEKFVLGMRSTPTLVVTSKGVRSGVDAITDWPKEEP